MSQVILEENTSDRRPRPPAKGFSDYQTLEEKKQRRNARKKLRRIANGSKPLSPVPEITYRTTEEFRKNTSNGAKVNWVETRQERIETISSPEFIQSARESAILRWDTPGTREAFGKLMKDFYSIEENRKAHSEKMKQVTDTPEWRLRCSLRVGPLAANWQGGLSFEPYCYKFNADFRRNVRHFFRHKCVLCLYEELETPEQKSLLNVHHVHYDKQSLCNDTSPRMFAPLCDSHHGITNGDREFWEALLEEIIIDAYGGQSYYCEEEWTRIKAQLNLPEVTESSDPQPQEA